MIYKMLLGGLFKMAVGDVVSTVNAAATELNFQPAAGVECMISTIGQEREWYWLYNATTLDRANIGYITGGGTASTQNGASNEKIFVTNAIYLKLAAANTWSCGYSGIQIK